MDAGTNLDEPLVARSWLNHPYAIWGVMGSSLLLASVCGALAYWFFQPTSVPEASVRAALEALDGGHVIEARAIAERYADDYRVDKTLQGVPPYVLGAIIQRDADQFLNPSDQKSLFELSIRHLQNAEELGFPPGYEDQGEYLLGRALYHGGRHAECIPVLLAAYPKDTARQEEIEAMLAEAYLAADDLEDQWEEALIWSKRYRERKTLSPEQRESALVREARILHQLGRDEEARLIISDIPLNSPRHVEALMIQGQIRLADFHRLKKAEQVEDSREALADAARLFGRAAGNQLVASDATRKASYLLTTALRLGGEQEAALEQATRTRKIYFRTPEGIAAGLVEAELLCELGREQESVAIYARTLREAALDKPFNNPWIDESDFRRRVTEAIERFITQHRFAEALEVSQALYPCFRREQSLRTEGDVQLAWGQYLQDKAEKAGWEEATKLRIAARHRFRSAGFNYHQLAKQRFATASYPEDLWKSADAYLKGQDFTRAVEMLEEYRRNESRDKQPRALVAIAQALVALDRSQDALELVLECLEFYPRDPSIYAARVLGGEAYMEQGKLAEAKALLSANLEDGRLEPASKEWQDSLFALGRVLHLEGEMFEAEARVKGALEVAESVPKEAFQLLEQSNESYLQAIRHLHTAIRRYPNDSRSTWARYLVAECHRRCSMLPRKKFGLVSIETQRVKFDREVKDHLEHAIRLYGELEYELTDKLETEGELHPVEAGILRNSYFAKGAALFEMQRYEQAIEAYSTASNRYQTDPIALEAFVQIAQCYSYLNRQVEARGTIEQAKIVLTRLPEDADYSETSHEDRDAWQAYLLWLGNTL